MFNESVLIQLSYAAHENVNYTSFKLSFIYEFRLLSPMKQIKADLSILFCRATKPQKQILPHFLDLASLSFVFDETLSSLTSLQYWILVTCRAHCVVSHSGKRWIIFQLYYITSAYIWARGRGQTKRDLLYAFSPVFSVGCSGCETELENHGKTFLIVSVVVSLKKKTNWGHYVAGCFKIIGSKRRYEESLNESTRILDFVYV